MEQTVRIVADSSCDLPLHLVQKWDITVIPLTVHFGTDVYRDGELPVEEFWAKTSSPHHPTTSQPPVGAFEEVFERLIARSAQVLCLTLTSKHSGTFNSAQLAAQRFGEAAQVFDSQFFSLGLGIQTLVAAQTARAGRSMQEILAVLEDLRERMRLMLVLDTLEYLQRGGRADTFITVAKRMTRALNIKITIHLVEGQLRLLGASRSFKGALRRMLAQVERLGPLEHAAVVHTRLPEIADAFADQLAQIASFPRERIWLHETGAVLATHGGPGVLGMLAVPIPQGRTSEP
jgi:DegV family protein with EDD domain